MPHGEDTAHNPKRKVTRLAHLIATQDNNFWRNNGLSNFASATPEETQKGIDGYRDDRDTFGSDDFNVRALRIAYGDAFKNRHNADYESPTSYPFQTK